LPWRWAGPSNRSHFKASDQWATASAEGEGPGWIAAAFDQLRGRLAAPLEPQRTGDNPVLRQMLELELAGQRQLQRLRGQLAPLPPVLQLAQGGYHTHSNQASRHSRVLAELAQTLAAFAVGLERPPNRPQVSLLAVSEFGRRLHENGSRGTNHGAASIALLLGDQLPHPVLGSHPSLNRLDARGDLIAGLNPPELYRQVLHKVWG
jgi:uncharacterized protein (DUF1501 family)